MNEVSKILIGSIELRLMNNAEYRYVEIFESGKWSKITATKLHQLSFDKKVENWLEVVRYSPVVVGISANHDE